MNFRQMVLDINHLYFDIANTSIVKDFSLKLYAKDIIVLLGPSGCGKTSILNIIAKIKEPSYGNIKLYTKSISYVFQEPCLIPFYSVMKNLKLACKDTQESEILSLLIKLNFAYQDMQKYPHELSGGMKARVNIARALLKNSNLLLLDEPFVGINYELKNFLFDFLINHIKSNYKSAILVTHDRLEALKLADKIYILDEKSQIKNITHIKTPHHLRDKKFLQQNLNSYEVFYE